MMKLILDGKDLKKPAEAGKPEEKKEAKKKAAPSNKARKAATNRQRVYRTIAKLRTVLASAHKLWKLGK